MRDIDIGKRCGGYC